LILLGVLSIIGCNQNKPNTPEVPEKYELIIDQPIDSILKKELEQIAVEDQTLRLMLPDVGGKFGNGSREENYIWSLIHRQDSICLDRTLKILEENGWLGKSRVGSIANKALWLVIQHAELEKQEKYLPLLKESVKIGESEGWVAAGRWWMKTSDNLVDLKLDPKESPIYQSTNQPTSIRYLPTWEGSRAKTQLYSSF